MKDFNFYRPTRIIFGKDAEKEVGKEVKKYGKKILFHYGEMATKCIEEFGSIGEFKELKEKDIVEILKLAK